MKIKLIKIIMIIKKNDNEKNSNDKNDNEKNDKKRII